MNNSNKKIATLERANPKGEFCCAISLVFGDTCVGPIKKDVFEVEHNISTNVYVVLTHMIENRHDASFGILVIWYNEYNEYRGDDHYWKGHCVVDYQCTMSFLAWYYTPMILTLVFHTHGTELPPLTREDAIRIIQSHERARQGRLRAKFMLDIRAQEVREKRRKQFPRPAMSEGHAACVLQKYIRGYLTRKKVLGDGLIQRYTQHNDNHLPEEHRKETPSLMCIPGFSRQPFNCQHLVCF